MVKKVILISMLKNESKIILRSLNSLKEICDGYVFLDTGSTDNTVNLITEYFAAKNIPGKVVVEPFKNFCHNRNFALQACVGMSDYRMLNVFAKYSSIASSHYPFFNAPWTVFSPLY